MRIDHTVECVETLTDLAGIHHRLGIVVTTPVILQGRIEARHIGRRQFERTQSHAGKRIEQRGDRREHNPGITGRVQIGGQRRDQPTRLTGTGRGKITDFGNFSTADYLTGMARDLRLDGRIQIIFGEQGLMTGRANTRHGGERIIGPGYADELRVKGADIGSIGLTKHLLHKGFEAITTDLIALILFDIQK